MERDVVRTRFTAQLRSFLDGIGMPLRKPPLMGGREIDLYVLYQTVLGAGGYHRVTQEKRWVEIGEQMKLREASHNAYALRQHYSKWLLQYELLHGGALLTQQQDSLARTKSNETSSVDDLCQPSGSAHHTTDAECCAVPMSTTMVDEQVATDGSMLSWNSLALRVQVAWAHL
jgi:hypothetical protein